MPHDDDVMQTPEPSREPTLRDVYRMCKETRSDVRDLRADIQGSKGLLVRMATAEVEINNTRWWKQTIAARVVIAIVMGIGGMLAAGAAWATRGGGQ